MRSDPKIDENLSREKFEKWKKKKFESKFETQEYFAYLSQKEKSIKKKIQNKKTRVEVDPLKLKGGRKEILIHLNQANFKASKLNRRLLAFVVVGFAAYFKIHWRLNGE